MVKQQIVTAACVAGILACGACFLPPIPNRPPRPPAAPVRQLQPLQIVVSSQAAEPHLDTSQLARELARALAGRKDGAIQAFPAGEEQVAAGELRLVLLEEWATPVGEPTPAHLEQTTWLYRFRLTVTIAGADGLVSWASGQRIVAIESSSLGRAKPPSGPGWEQAAVRQALAEELARRIAPQITLGR